MTVTVACAVVTLLAPAAAGAAGLTPAQIHRAYALPTKARKAPIVAVIVAYDTPTAEQDLLTYTRRYGIADCTGVDGCFRRVNQRGAAGPYPALDPTGGQWTGETVLSTQTVRGVCQNCRLLLVEADSDAPADLAASVETAVRLGAKVVTTSYLLGDPGRRKAYDQPGVVITAATGDDGFFDGAFFPAALPDVVAVGGTKLSIARDGTYRSERVWDAGRNSRTTSGCSVSVPARRWQAPFSRRVGCETRRSLADIAVTASPGGEVYTSTPVNDKTGWAEGYGTSFSSPLVAGVFGLAGGVPLRRNASKLLYENFRRHPRRGLRDVTRGQNGSCGSRVVCRATRGFDGPTGIGTPRGLAAFRR